MYKISMLLSVVFIGCSFSEMCFEKFEVQLLAMLLELLNRTKYFCQVYAAYHFLHFGKVNW